MSLIKEHGRRVAVSSRLSLAPGLTLDYAELGVGYTPSIPWSLGEHWLNGSEYICYWGDPEVAFGHIASDPLPPSIFRSAPLEKRYDGEHDRLTYASAFSAFVGVFDGSAAQSFKTQGGRSENLVLHGTGDGRLFSQPSQAVGRDLVAGYPLTLYPSGKELEYYRRVGFTYHGAQTGVPFIGPAYVPHSGYNFQPSYCHNLVELIDWHSQIDSAVIGWFPYFNGSYAYNGITPGVPYNPIGAKAIWYSGFPAFSYEYRPKFDGGLLVGFSYKRLAKFGYSTVVLGSISDIEVDLFPPRLPVHSATWDGDLLGGASSITRCRERCQRLFSELSLVDTLNFDASQRSWIGGCSIFTDGRFPGWLIDDKVFETTVETDVTAFAITEAQDV